MAIAFAAGFLLKGALSPSPNGMEPSPSVQKKKTTNIPPRDQKVTGIGGIFFKSSDPLTLKVWYEEHLGLDVDAYGTTFEWWQGADSTRKGFTQWSPFSEKTKYFDPSEKQFMINYRVGDLSSLVEELEASGVPFTDSVSTYEYGKFVHILDPEGNKIELWEPYDEEYDKIVDGRTK
jgi:predicted enzyme related to lactoylglutathione lyase